jgi:catechol 2,3-dioxygenase-like lactoylglutathione lyase family enzyme
MTIRHFSHVAYRCTNARETVEFYTKMLGLEYKFAVAENRVPSTGEFSPHIHIFLEVAPGSYLAFFELAEAPPMSFDPNTPSWVQHIALRVDTEGEVAAFKKRLDEAGISTLGVTDHGIYKSIYFRDPSGHRLEVTCETMAEDVKHALVNGAWDLLGEWDRTKRAPEIGWHRAKIASDPVASNGLNQP